MMRPVLVSKESPAGRFGEICQLVTAPPVLAGSKGETAWPLVKRNTDGLYPMLGGTSTTAIERIAGALAPPVLVAVTK